MFVKNKEFNDPIGILKDYTEKFSQKVSDMRLIRQAYQLYNRVSGREHVNEKEPNKFL